MMMTLAVRYQLKQLIDEQPEKYASLTGIKPEFFQVVLLSTAYVDVFNLTVNIHTYIHTYILYCYLPNGAFQEQLLKLLSY